MKNQEQKIQKSIDAQIRELIIKIGKNTLKKTWII